MCSYAVSHWVNYNNCSRYNIQPYTYLNRTYSLLLYELLYLKLGIKQKLGTYLVFFITVATVQHLQYLWCVPCQFFLRISSFELLLCKCLPFWVQWLITQQSPTRRAPSRILKNQNYKPSKLSDMLVTVCPLKIHTVYLQYILYSIQQVYQNTDTDHMTRCYSSTVPHVNLVSTALINLSSPPCLNWIR